MGSSMTFQIKRVIETFSTERTQVSFGITVAVFPLCDLDQRTLDF